MITCKVFGQDVHEDNVAVTCAQTPGSLYGRHLAQLQHARADHSGSGGPPECSDYDYYVPDAGAGVGCQDDHHSHTIEATMLPGIYS